MEEIKNNNIPNPNDFIVEPTVIDAQNVSIEGDNINSGKVDIEHDDIESTSIKNLIKDGSVGFFEYVIEFEEDHPWIFFLGIALILFVIVGGIISFFFGNSIDFDFFSGDDSSTEITEEIVEDIPTKSYEAAVSGLEAGFLITSDTGFDHIVYKGESDVFLANEFSFVQQLRSALLTDIQAVLAPLDQEKRLETLREYLLYLIELEKKGADNFIKLNTLSSNFQTEKESYEVKKAEAKEKVNLVFESGGANELTKALEELSEYEDKYDLVENKFILTNQIADAYTEPLQLVQARIAAIRANKDILLFGLKVFSINQAGLDLIQSGSVNDWYSSKAPISKSVKSSGNYAPISSNQSKSNRSIPNIISKDALDSIMDRGR